MMCSFRSQKLGYAYCFVLIHSLSLYALLLFLFLFVYFIYFGGEWWREVGQITRSHWESDSANQLGLEIVASFSPMFRRKKMPMNWIQRSLYLSWSSLCEYFYILKENHYHKNTSFYSGPFVCDVKCSYFSHFIMLPRFGYIWKSFVDSLR